MRRVLVDYARSRRYAKRGGGAVRVTLEEAADVAGGKAEEIPALEDALETLASFDPVRARVVELRFYGGLSHKEIAEVMRVHANTVTHYWDTARAWLYRELAGEGEAREG